MGWGQQWCLEMLLPLLQVPALEMAMLLLLLLVVKQDEQLS